MLLSQITGPQPSAFMSGSTAWRQSNPPRTLTPMTASYSSIGISSIGRERVIPAPLTRMVTLPGRALTSLTAEVMEPGRGRPRSRPIAEPEASPETAATIARARAELDDSNVIVR
jgi:hypothetical protein